MHTILEKCRLQLDREEVANHKKIKDSQDF